MKRIIIILVCVVTLISLVACGRNDLEDFKEAIQKTAEITKGSMAVKSKVEMEFNTDGLTEEEIKALNYVKNVVMNMNFKYNDEEERVIAKNYLSFGGLGFDLDFYMDKDKAFIKMPMLGKYIVISDMVMDSEESGSPEELDGSFIAFKKKLEGILQEENVFSGKDTIITTQEGEVKATEYNISLKDQQIKNLLGEIMVELSSNKEIERNFNKYIEFNMEGIDTPEDITLEGLLEDLDKAISRSTIKDFNYVAFVDIDGYIVKEDIVFEIEFMDTESGKVKDLRYQFSSEQWNINEDQDFDYPELNDDNTLDIESLNQGIPFMIEDIMEVK